MNDNDFYPYSYSAIGHRYYEAHPGHYKKRVSMIGALNSDNFKAPFMFEGHCNTKMFEIYIEQVLLPVLEIGMTVVIDNPSFHKSGKITNLIESVGCELLYLPAYSPDLNPIENWWHKLKTQIRKLMRNSKMALTEAMADILNKSSVC